MLLQEKRTCYAQSSQIRQIRKKMVEIMTREASSCDLKELVSKFIPEAIGMSACPESWHVAASWCASQVLWSGYQPWMLHAVRSCPIAGLLLQPSMHTLLTCLV